MLSFPGREIIAARENATLTLFFPDVAVFRSNQPIEMREEGREGIDDDFRGCIRTEIRLESDPLEEDTDGGKRLNFRTQLDNLEFLKQLVQSIFRIPPIIVRHVMERIDESS